jgi:beta-1,2-mannobiose phosphorylase / 1,2-beta-oligomannan phosphorylase
MADFRNTGEMTDSTLQRPVVQTAVRRLSSRLLVVPDDVSPSQDDFEVVGVFNPGAIRVGAEVVLLVRVAERPREQRPGFTGLPRWDAAGGLTVDWVRDEDLDVVDPRVVMLKATGTIRLTFISHLRVVRCGDGRAVREVGQVTFAPEGELEEYGVEDPRISFIDGRYYITYVSVSRHGPATALASTTDFETFERHGVIFCPENKDVVLLPEKLDGTFAALHRPVCGAPFTRPEMWIARSPDLIHWGAHTPLDIPSLDWQSGRVGGGVPPIRVPEGLLTIYHGNVKPTEPGEVGAYFGGALLLDAADPTRVLGQLPGPMLAPEEDFEVAGFVSDVVFPTGAVQDGDSLLVYYGAADAYTAVAEFSLREILDSMIAL